MISVAEALNIILELQPCAKPVRMPLRQAGKMVLATDVVSPVAMPLFDASAMDGYAVRVDDLRQADASSPVSLKLIEEIWAGKNPVQEVLSGQCSKIMTGAAMPVGADAVVMRENVKLENGRVVFCASVTVRENIRLKGEEFQSGEILIKAGTVIDPAVMSVLAGVGVDHVEVFPRPRVAVIATGSELVVPGDVVTGAKIYESNSWMLSLALEEMGCESLVLGPVPDEESAIRSVIMEAMERASHVLVCGGVSVGDYDLNKKILKDLEVSEVFWKVAQKPGKPLFFGTRGSVAVFGLPGNPASSLTCFHEYVAPALRKAAGFSVAQSRPVEVEARLRHDIRKKAGLTHFLRCQISMIDNLPVAEVLPKQNSHMMTSMIGADGLLVFPAEATFLQSDSKVKVHVFSGRERMFQTVAPAKTGSAG